MRAGNLTSWVWLEQDAGTLDDHGEHVADWQPVAGVWAEVSALTGGESQRGGQIQASAQYQVTMRSNDLAAAGWRINDDGTYYYPVYVRETAEETIAVCKVQE
jgi:head-tail adaptor